MTTRLFLFTSLFLFTGVLASFNNKDSVSLTAKSIQQTMTKVNDELYVCKYEVSNLEYRNFLVYLKAKDASLAEKYKVDTTKWLSELRYCEPMANYYHLHPAYNSYPVVCVSYEAALAYCDWLTEQYNADVKRKFKKVRFFLPSEEQWTAVANGGNKNKMYPWSNYYLRNKAGEFLCNFKHVGDENVSYDTKTKEYTIIPEAKIAGSLSDNVMYTAAVNSFEATAPYGIHNMSGNVAEMVSEKGMAKGGSYNSPGHDVRIQSKMNYTEASPEVGFRVFMKIEP
jgi:formylglycine-generating enzyme required for sulfatase activity